MAVGRKAKVENTSQTPLQDEAAFQAYLKKGGSTAKSEAEQPTNVRFSLTVPGHICQQIDRLRDELPIKTSRHKWILEAVVQRIQRENGQEV